MAIRVFVPSDAAALSVGADEVAAAIARRSRSAAALPSIWCATAPAGLFWLEPLVEVETPAGPRRLWPGRRRRCR